jgi:hypothetical protein
MVGQMKIVTHNFAILQVETCNRAKRWGTICSGNLQSMHDAPPKRILWACFVGYNDPQVIMTHNLLLIPGSPGKSSDIHMYVQVILECQHAEYFETFSVTLRQKSLKQNSLRV